MWSEVQHIFTIPCSVNKEQWTLRMNPVDWTHSCDLCCEATKAWWLLKKKKYVYTNICNVYKCTRRNHVKTGIETTKQFYLILERNSRNNSKNMTSKNICHYKTTTNRKKHVFIRQHIWVEVYLHPRQTQRAMNYHSRVLVEFSFPYESSPKVVLQWVNAHTTDISEKQTKLSVFRVYKLLLEEKYGINV